MSNGKAIIILLTDGLIKKISLYNFFYIEFFSRTAYPQEKLGELDLENYPTKSDFKTAIVVDTSQSAKKTDLNSIKSDIDELDFDKLENLQVVEVI